MTKKDYVLIAAALASVKPTHTALRTQWIMDIEALAARLATTNPRFDRARFLAACGVMT